MFKQLANRKYQTPPAAIASLRGHAFGIVSVHIQSHHLYIASGDEGGWIFIWSLITRRPFAIFKAHEKAIIKISWIKKSNDNRLLLLSQGRDNKLHVFEIDSNLEYTTSLPTQNSDAGLYKKPWMVHSQDINSLNFCGVAVNGSRIALSNTLSSQKIDVYEIFPEFKRIYFGVDPDDVTVSSTSFSEDRKRGIVMALVLTDDRLIAGYESGEVAFYEISGDLPKPEIQLVNISKPHKQPILSLCLDKSSGTLISTSADSLIIKHDLSRGTQIDTLNTKHPGLGFAAIRHDGKILATTGWDGFVRLFDYNTLGYLSAFKADDHGITCADFGSSEPDQATETKTVELVMKRKIQAINWLAIGTKNNVIKLYDIY